MSSRKKSRSRSRSRSRSDSSDEFLPNIKPNIWGPKSLEGTSQILNYYNEEIKKNMEKKYNLQKKLVSLIKEKDIIKNSSLIEKYKNDIRKVDKEIFKLNQEQKEYYDLHDKFYDKEVMEPIRKDHPLNFKPNKIPGYEEFYKGGKKTKTKNKKSNRKHARYNSKIRKNKTKKVSFKL
tara:strand:- start:1106 stop:1639 length:534 start_codon:yes stop_codon:yes gene_type:complete